MRAPYNRYTHDGDVQHGGGLRHGSRKPLGGGAEGRTRTTELGDCDGAPTLCLTLSRESGVSTEKPIRMTWAFE